MLGRVWRYVPDQSTAEGVARELQVAAQLASVEGLEGLSIGQLAEAANMSKSGLYAHFGLKEELQLATIEAARQPSSTTWSNALSLRSAGGPAPCNM